jgi:hypothetical protein
MITKRIKLCIQKSSKRILRLGLFTTVTAAASLLAVGDTATVDFHNEHGNHEHAVPAKLVQIVRAATQQFLQGPGDKYKPLFGCVSGPDHGAMGIHYINLDLVMDGEIDEMKPEALIYEPSISGLRLVGVEYIVDAAGWMSNPQHTAPPMLEGQAFQLVASPNRFGLNPFFELHVWAWRDNPQGAFVDWNNQVSCEGQ